MYGSPDAEGFLTTDDPHPRGDLRTIDISNSPFCIYPEANCLALSAQSSLSRSTDTPPAPFITQTLSHHDYLVSTHSCINRASTDAFHSVYSFDQAKHALVYKPVAKKVRTVSTTMPPEFRITRKLPDDPLAGMPPLPTHPPEFVPGIRFTQERLDKLDLDPAKWLWPEELKLVRWLVSAHEKAFAWDASERGRLNETYFPPVKIPTIQHTPWSQRNIPIPPAITKEVIRIVREKIDTGVYEPSTAAYRSRWFCVVKKDKTSLRLVHDLQLLNKVTIRDASVPPFVDHLAAAFACYACYSILDLLSGYDQRSLHEDSRDMTTFGTPLGPHRLTTLPQGHANAVQVYQGDMAFILQNEIPDFTYPFIDDVPIKSVKTRYQRADGSYETIPENTGIRRFIWEHCIVVNRILQRLENVGVTVSATKFVLAAPTAIIVGHKCTLEGRIPEESKVQKIRDWPECRNVTHVRGFLGTCGVLRIFIKNFSKIAKPLVNLTRKNAPFIWGPEQQESMQILKDSILESPALRPIDYECGREVILAVDTSNIAVGYILLQIGEDGKRYPDRFGSMALTEVESRYSQAKLELYGLFRALRAVRVFIFGVTNLTVEVDAKYIKGMINNPDLQPNATINRWIAGILLFQFTLVHVPAAKHAGVDGLSRRPHADEDPDEDDDHEDWLDRSYSFSMEILNDRKHAIARTDADNPRRPHDSPVPDPLTRSPALFVLLGTAEINHNEVRIPRSDVAKAQDLRILNIRKFLENRKRPPELKDEEYDTLINASRQYFILDGRMWRKHMQGKHQLVVAEAKRYKLLKEAHDDLGHKGVFTIRIRLLLRFWWPLMTDDIKWYNRTCHECQIRQIRKLHIPPIVPMPGGIFRRVHIDVMMMPKAGGFDRIIHARCALTAYPEWRMLRKESTKIIASFIFEDLFCRWGPIVEIVTDNAPVIKAAVDDLVARYNVHHVRISPYNSQANGIIERRHRDVREAIMKSSEGEESRWYSHAHAAFWAERVTIQQSTGLSPYFMVHGVEPIFPFDLAEATFLVDLPDQQTFTSEDLIAWRTRQLMKRQEDLDSIKDKVMKARFRSIREFEEKFRNTIKDHDFAPGTLVLVRNSKIEYELNRKTKPRYLGPMIVLRRTLGGSYVLGELDGAISKLRYAAFRVLPYFPRSESKVSVTSITGLDEEALDKIANEAVEEPADEEFDIGSDE